MPTLRLIFSLILGSMIAVTVWAELRVPLFSSWKELSDPWSMATLFDAYAGFLTFYCWVWYKERSLALRGMWFVLIMCLGNIAMSVYVLRELWRLGPNEGPRQLLTKRG